uniref:Uncharacterized protein n=1 Tax=Rhodopseudomonas palustris (strain BisA53) TaxID=316055 RepID=Q07LI1_RHOP5
MGDFERTFGAGADAASIIDHLSNNEEDMDNSISRTLEDQKRTSPEERILKAKQRGVKIYWQPRDDIYPDAVYSGLPIQPDFFAFDKSTKNNIGRVYRLRYDDSPLISPPGWGWVRPSKQELWGWSMYAHSNTKSVPFRNYGATGSQAEAESFMAEAYGLLLEHNRQKQRFSFFVFKEILGSREPNIFTDDGGGDPSHLEIEIDSESDAVITASTQGNTLYIVISCGPNGDFGSVHHDIEIAIAAFSAQFDGWLDNDAPMRPSYELQIDRAIVAILAADASGDFTPACFQTILYADTEISIAKVLMLGSA